MGSASRIALVALVAVGLTASVAMAAVPSVEVGDTVAYTCGGGTVSAGARKPVEVSARVTAVRDGEHVDLALDRSARKLKACRTTRPSNVPYNADPSVGHTWRT